jgi:hypothetical protein
MNATTPASDRGPAVSAPLARPDRCDRCGAAAMVEVTLATGGELLFCAHHARKHAARLLEIGAGLRSTL